MLVFIVRPLASLTGEEIARTRALSGEPQRARDIHLLAARLDPFDPVPQARGGVLQVQFGDINGGLRSFREVDDRSPGRPDVAALLGTTQWSAGDLDGAEQTFRAGIADDPWLARGSDLYTPLALLLIGQGRDDEALSLLAEGFWVSPINVADPAWVVDADAHTVLLDRTYHDGDQPDDDPVLRARILQRIGVFTPDQPNVEAGDLSITRVFDLMEADARATLQSDPQRGVEMLDQLALCYSTAQLPEGAKRLLEEAVRVQPDANFARYDLARTYLALDDDASAIHELQEVIRIGNASSRYDLRVAFAERDLALIASRQERFADAATLMRQALKDYRWAYLPFANETLARAYDNLGDPSEAEKWRRRERFLNGG
jgi:FimV-like protein